MESYQMLRYRSAKTRQRWKDISTVRSLCWKNLSVWKRRKIRGGVFQRNRYVDEQLLCDVNGYIGAGCLVAVMGPSGSGKTTLLTAVSFRSTDGIRGDVCVNGSKLNRHQMAAISGFVPQNDLVVESLTVFEHLYLMAVLKMDKGTSKFDVLEKVSILLNQFALEKSVSTYLRHLSGGERRRLSIAVEILTDPHILFCDEPTTGLDSSSAAMVVDILKKFSSRGKMVICSIHQPASGLYDLFDDVLLLATGGRLAYFGPALGAVEYFERFSLKCPESYNVAEYLIKIISIKDPSDSDRIGNLCDKFAKSKQFFASLKSINLDCHQSVSSKYQNLEQFDESMKRVGLIRQTYWLLWRDVKNLRTDYVNTLMQFLPLMFFAVLSSSLFSNILYHKETRRQNVHGFIGTLVAQCVWDFALCVVYVFPEFKPLLLREIGARLYTIEAYYLSRIIYEAFLCAIVTLIFVTIIKVISDAFDLVNFAELFIVFYVLLKSSTALGCMLSAIFSDVTVLISVAAIFIEITDICSGVYMKLSSFPTCLKWVKYVSLFYYGLQALTVLEWKCVDLEEMKLSNISDNDPAAFANLKMAADYGFSVMDYSYNLVILTGLTVLFHFTAYVFISRRSKEQGVY